MGRMIVHFAGEGSGVAELTWGQRDILAAMRRQQSWMPLPHRHALPEGTTLEDVAGWLRYIVTRHQALRTKLLLPPDGPHRQVLHGSGQIEVDLIEAGPEDPATVAQETIERFVRYDYDFERDWPIFVAVVLKEGVPVWQVANVCHIVWDVFGALALVNDVAARDAASAGAAPPPVTAMQPLEQARWQNSPAGRRHNEAVLRYWADLLRQMPAQQFPAPVDRGEPRDWSLNLRSPATHLAIQAISSRTGVGSAQIILTLFLMALSRITGVDPSVIRVAVNNRFRRGLADSVSILTQYGLCLVDVAGAGFDEALARVTRRVIGTFKNAYYDPVQLAELVERIGRERGEELDVDCYYNDRRFTRDPDPGAEPPAAADIHAALPATTVIGEPMTRISERLFVAIEEAPGTFHLLLQADTRYLPREAMEACARTVEELAVAAATVPAEVAG